MQGKEGKLYEQKVSKTLIISVRFKPSTIATIAKFLASQGEPIRSLSDLSQISLESFQEMIQNKDKSLIFDNETSSVQYLQNIGLLNNPSNTNKERIHSILSMDSLNLGQKENTLMNLSEENQIIHAKALEYLKILEAKRQKNINYDEIIERAKASGQTVTEQTTDPKEMAKLMALSSPTIVASNACETNQEIEEEND